MNKLVLKRKFNKINKSFKDNNFNLDTIAELLEEIRFNITGFSKSEFDLLMKVPYEILKHDCQLKDKEKWVEENREYFSGNVEWLKDEYFENLGYKFTKNMYCIDDLLGTVKYISDNYELLIKKFGRGIETPLRNIEVTIRDDVNLICFKQFNSKGNIFAQCIDEAINL